MVLGQAPSLVLISLAAALLPGLGRALRLPSAVVEILFGVVLGGLGLNLSGEWFPFLAELGFLLLMFHAGLEIDFRALARQSLGQLVGQILVFAATLGLALVFAWFLGRGVFLALVLSTTSLGLVLPTLKESGIIKGRLAQAILIAATLADFLTLLGITFFNLGHEHGLSWRFVYPLPLFAGFGLLLWAGRRWAWWNPHLAGRFLLGDDPQEQGVRFSLALLFLFVGLSHLVDLEPVLGAFMGGCVISFVFREKEQLENKLSALGFGFLVPIFFIHVGMSFNLANLAGPGQLWFCAQLLVLALLVKLLPSLLLVGQGLSLGLSLRAGLLLSSRLSLIVAAAAIGLERGYLSAPERDSIVLLALLTCFLGPTLFKLSMRGHQPPAPEQGPPPAQPRTNL